jgi:exosortase H (IPTLxxWG-CTERM-specific)
VKLLRGGGAVGFSVRALTLLAVLTLLTITSWFRAGIEGPLISINADVSRWILTALGTPTLRDGQHLHAAGFSVEVVSGCTGLFVFIILLAAVLAFPASWRMKAAGLAWGAALIFVLNQLRIVTLFLAGARAPWLFEDLHLFVWQGAIVVLIAFYWYAWASRALPAGRPAQA